MELTPKQMKFVQCVSEGMSQSDAYRTAYGAENMKDATIHKRASELMDNREIKGRLAQVRAELAEVSLWSRVDSVKALIDALDVAKEDGNVSGIVAAVKELNAMHGFNAPQQVQLSGAMDINKIVIETVIIPQAPQIMN